MLSESEENRPTMQEVLEHANHMRTLLDNAVFLRTMRKCLGMTENFETKRTGKPVLARVFKQASLEEVNQLVKLAIHSFKCSSLSSALQSLTVKSERKGYKVKFMLDKRADLGLEDLKQTEASLNLFSEFEDNEKGQIIFENESTHIKIIVFEGHYQLLRKPVIVKQCNIQGLLYLNEYIKKALLQVKVESLYICKLFDISVRHGTSAYFEVNLIMEGLERDLQEDIKSRVFQQNPYTEEELIHILVEVSDALIFTKLQGIGYEDAKPANIMLDNGHYR